MSKEINTVCPTVSGPEIGALTALWFVLLVVNGTLLIWTTFTSEHFSNYDSSYLYNDFN
jgi:hypothetical protein